MFTYYYVHLRQPFEQVESRLFEALDRLEGWGDAAYRDGEQIHTKLAIGGGHAAVAKTVRMHVGTPRRGDAETVVSLTWEATGMPGLFPTMEADLIVAGLGADLTQLTLRGSYEPPLGRLGRALDRLMLHRIAEASVKSFVDRIAGAIEGDQVGATRTAQDPPHEGARA